MQRLQRSSAMATRTVQKTLERAFRIDSKNFRKIVDLLSRHCTTIKYDCRLSDGSTIESKSEDDVLAIPNVRRKVINKIKIVGIKDYNRLIELGFSKYGIDYILNGPVAWTEEFEPMLLASLEDTRSTFWIYSDVPVYVRRMSSLACVALACILISRQIGYVPIFPRVTLNGYVFTFLLIFLLSVGDVYEWVISSLFPVSDFLIGDGVERAADTKSRRALVLGSVILAAMVGWAVNKLG